MSVSGENTTASAVDRQPSVAILPVPDRFEDFFDKIGMSLESFRDDLTGGWLFNFVEALQAAGVRPVLYFVSARVPTVVRWTHRATGAPIRFLPAPWLHRKLQGGRDRLRISSPSFRSLLSYVATPWRDLAREFRRDACAAILCQEYEHPRFDEALVVGRALRIPVFATYQGANVPGSSLELPFRHLAMRRASGLITGSRWEMQRVRSTYGVSIARMALLPNALDVALWRPGNRNEARAALGIPMDAVVVVWHGRVVVEHKGLDVLLDAWERLYTKRSSRPYLLLLVGSGQDRDVLRRRVSSFPPGAVRWEDRRIHDPSDIRRHLVSADIATLSSRSEGFAVSVIEAMACGLPVVATDVSGVAEAFGEEVAGVIVPRQDPARLAEALARLLDSEPLRRELGERARRRAQKEFSLEVVGGRLRAFMEERGAFFGSGVETDQ